MANKFIPKSPDPFLKKPEDMAPAKFGHLNELVKEINAGGGGGSLTLTTTGSGAATLAGNNLNIPTPTEYPFTTTSVTVTAAELIAASTLGDTVKTLLPSPGAGKYILVNSIVVKFKDATVAFDGGPTYVLTALTSTFNFNINFPGTTSGVTGYVGVAVNQVNQSLDLIFSKGTAPTTGDGNCIFEISYSIQDF